ncbi:MAG TPA: YfiR family protein [Solimonas sp.]|nr:YfiR family protein [Solimonas sp.]
MIQRSTRQRRRRAVAALLCGALALAAGAPVQAADDLELKVKAAFLFNFAKFVVWPEQKFESAQAPVELCVAEPDPLGPALDDAVRGKKIESRPLAVRRVPWRLAEMKSCHLLYVAARDERMPAGLLDELAAAGVMVVHESGEAIPGGVVRLFLDERKMRIEINVAAAERAGLHISSQLMSVAQVVRR